MTVIITMPFLAHHQCVLGNIGMERFLRIAHSTAPYPKQYTSVYSIFSYVATFSDWICLFVNILMLCGISQSPEYIFYYTIVTAYVNQQSARLMTAEAQIMHHIIQLHTRYMRSLPLHWANETMNFTTFFSEKGYQRIADYMKERQYIHVDENKLSDESQ